MRSPASVTRTVAASLLLCLLPFPPSSLAADGDLDPDFGAGITFTPIQCDPDERMEMLLQPDGCVLVAGVETDVCVARLLPDGSLDPGFGVGGVARVAVQAERRAGPGLALQADGRILVAAGRTGAAGGDVLIRLLPDGSPDPAFGVGGMATVPFTNVGRTGLAVGVQPDGRIVLAAIDAATSRYVLARFESSGPLDISYAVDGVARVGITGPLTGDVDLVIQPDGKAVIAGIDAATYEGFVARWMTGGTLDPGFRDPGLGTIPHTGVTTSGNAIDLQTRLQGGFRFAGHDGASNFTVGFLDSGALDPADDYTTYGHQSVDQRSAVAIDQTGDGTWYLGGMTDPTSYYLGAYVQRCTNNFWADRNYGNESIAFTGIECYTDDCMAMVAADDHKVFIAAANGLVQGIWVVQIDRYGTMHGGFGESRRGWVSLGPRCDASSGFAMADQPIGKVLAAGHEESRCRNFVTRFRADGVRDLDFGDDGFAFALPVSRQFPIGETAWPGLAVLEDGRFFLAGTDSVEQTHYVSRYSADGVLDTSYGDAGVARTDLPIYGDVHLALVAQSDGRVVLASVDLLAQDYFLACFDVTGALDPGFGLGGIVRAGLETSDLCHVALARQADGKIILAGNDTAHGWERLVRFTSNGQPDPSFGVDGIATWGIGSDYRIQPSLAIQESGGILLACHAEALGEVVVVRYTTTGQIDQTFGTGVIARAGLLSNVSAGTALVQESDGKFLLTSFASTYPPSYTARFSADGILDVSFGVGGIARGGQLYVLGENVAAALSPRGGPIVLCQDGFFRQGLLIHLLSSTPVTAVPEGTTVAGTTIIRSVSPNPFGSSTTLQFDSPSGAGLRVEVLDLRGRRIRTLVGDEESMGLKAVVWDGRDDLGHEVGSGTYFFRVSAGEHAETKKIVLLR